MKTIVITMAILLYTSGGFAQKGAKIKFTTENNTIDYGTIAKSKDNGIRVFEFTNTGNTPLIIYAIQSTASSTILSKQTDTILPGKSGTIKVKYNMVVGPIRKTITVESNAINYDGGRIPLKIKGEVTNK